MAPAENTFPCYGIIPARYGSTRFPGKPLAMIFGKPMIWHVYIQSLTCPQLSNVAVATDDERIRIEAESLEIPVFMTHPDHPSGTDRVLEVSRQLDLPKNAVVINIQGDEPAIEPAMLTELIEPFNDPAVHVATLACQITAEEAKSADQVKVVFDNNSHALYFSRAAIPFHRENAAPNIYGHIGLYAFRMQTLERFASLDPSPLERVEKLEQLRMLENGIPVKVIVTQNRSFGVDQPEDLQIVRNLMRERRQVSYRKALGIEEES